VQFHPGTSYDFIDVLTEIVPANVPVALLDFPWHSNPGDAAIWKGENLALATLGHRVVYTSTTATFDRNRLDRLLADDGVVLLHGGGNFGDLWPAMHAHRESIIQCLSDRRIVQLPQTVHFDNEEAGEESLARLATHPNLTVMARDQRSLDRLVQAGISARLSRDATSALWPGRPVALTPVGSSRVLFLLRSDKERRTPIPTNLISEAQDWTDLGLTFDPTDRTGRVVDRCLNIIDHTQERFGRALPALCRARREQQRLRSNQLFDAAVDVILSHDVIVTDRLHAMLFGLAYGRPVVAVDSGYGKLDSYIDTFLDEEPLLHRIGTFDQLPEALDNIGSPQ
jgi:exopolysaccharide biosynthesis predicted pyruvyltransferase EpsI